MKTNRKLIFRESKKIEIEWLKKGWISTSSRRWWKFWENKIFGFKKRSTCLKDIFGGSIKGTKEFLLLKGFHLNKFLQKKKIKKNINQYTPPHVTPPKKFWSFDKKMFSLFSIFWDEVLKFQMCDYFDWVSKRWRFKKIVEFEIFSIH